MGIAIAIGIIYVIVVAVVLLVQYTQSGGGAVKKNFKKHFAELQQALKDAKKQHGENLDKLQKMGFHNDRTNCVGEKYFYFDYNQKLTVAEFMIINDRFLSVTVKNPLEIYKYPKSFCQELVIFPYDKITGCALIQDGAVIKNSEGNAALAGVGIPMFSSLQGIASSKSNEHQTGILSVRLTINDIRMPSVLFNFTDAVLDKSSDAYVSAFQHAQEVFGIFDAIVQINKASDQSLSSEQAKISTDVQTIQNSVSNSENVENIFEKIRQLGKLKEEGLLTEEEYIAKKKIFMDQIK